MADDGKRDVTDDEKPDDDAPEDDGSPAQSPAERARRARLAKLLSIRRKLEPSEVTAARQVFGLVFRAHYQTLWKRVWRRGLSRQDAEDIVMATFHAAFREICESGFPKSFGAQLNRIQKGKLLNFIRSKKRSPLSLGLPSSSRPELAEPGHDPERARDLEDLEKNVRPLLSDEQWEIVELVLLNGVEAVEAAAILGIPEGTVHSRLRRAKEKLARLAHRWVPPSKREKM